jgi:hypothetical protein
MFFPGWDTRIAGLALAVPVLLFQYRKSLAGPRYQAQP